MTVQTLRVLVPDPLLYSLGPHQNGDSSHLWTDHRLSRETKLRLYKLSMCLSLTHCCTAWALTRTVRVTYGLTTASLGRRSCDCTLSVCSSLTHCCTAWALTRTVTRVTYGLTTTSLGRRSCDCTLSVCSSLTHCCTAWALTRTVTQVTYGLTTASLGRRSCDCTNSPCARP